APPAYFLMSLMGYHHCLLLPTQPLSEYAQHAGGDGWIAVERVAEGVAVEAQGACAFISSDECRGARRWIEHGHLADEAARFLRADEFLARAILFQNPDLAFQQDEDFVARLSFDAERLARRVLVFKTRTREFRQALRRNLREDRGGAQRDHLFDGDKMLVTIRVA